MYSLTFFTPIPRLDPAAPLASVPDTIPNPGISIGHVSKKRLKILQFYVLHLQRIQRNMTPVAVATLARLTTYYHATT
jgi:hypothetical protein